MPTDPRRGVPPLFVALVALLAVPIAPARADDDPVDLIRADSEIPPEERLDVGIRVFDPGIPDGDEAQLEEQGIYADVRRSEAHFIPFLLKRTLVDSAQWGAVSVLPAGGQTQDVNVVGEIVLSTGRAMVLQVRVVDSTGRVWRERRYKQLADQEAYSPAALEPLDPLQSIYNRIANDLLESREKLDPQELAEIRQVSRLRFAADLAPDAYAGYLSEDRKGRYDVEHLPAADDPMIERLERIRRRDDAFVDTLNGYYADFYDRMVHPYGEWRRISYDEEMQLRAERKEARMQKILGGLLILGGIASDGSSSASRVARDAAVIGGGMVLKNGIDQGKQAKIHVAALSELAASFDAEMSPLVVEVEGQVLELQGSAETQYEEWRDLLREILATDTDLPVDLNATSAAADAPGKPGP